MNFTLLMGTEPYCGVETVVYKGVLSDWDEKEKQKSNRFVKKLQKKQICVRLSFRQGTADSKDIY